MGVKLFEQLQDLTIRPASEQEAEVMYQTLRNAPNIHYLDVNCNMFYGSFLPYLNLHQFLPHSVGNLKTLHLRFVIEGYKEWSQYHDTIRVISEALSLVNSLASLEELVMSLTIESTELLALFGMIRKLKVDYDLHLYSSLWTPHTVPNADEEMQADLYEYIESAFQAFRRSSLNSRLNFKLQLQVGNGSLDD
ncbi:hypothetical protein BJ165DRAFT_1528668 [Panaeolus papilionaceus]|nr:hypothetical protein BJ165DRAFT_1528668 [Panaeolus papilionaceus]